MMLDAKHLNEDRPHTGEVNTWSADARLHNLGKGAAAIERTSTKWPKTTNVLAAYATHVTP